LGESVFHTTVTDIETVWKMNCKDRAEHNEGNASRTKSNQYARKDCQAPGKLRQAD
jgi:hypothetical protein